MIRLLSIVLPAALWLVPAHAQERAPVRDAIRIVQLQPAQGVLRRYPDALPSLLRHMNEETNARFDTDPLYIQSLQDEELFKHPFLYVNCDEQPTLNYSDEEKSALRRYLEQGGFLYLDAGIKASFLGADLGHSYAAWEERPEVKELFAGIFPEKVFVPLPRDHELFRCFYKGLPENKDLKIEANQKKLPETVLTFVEREKWPQGTYSFVGLRVKGRIAVLASPICAMGWGKDEFGAWIPPISFRIRESAEGFDDKLKLASFKGGTFEVKREDGLMDILYSEPGKRPLWVQEPTGKWRIFKYYSGEEISNYAHAFYTRLGVNVFMYALTN